MKMTSTQPNGSETLSQTGEFPTAKSTHAASKMFVPPIYEDSLSTISSQAFQGGRLLWSLPDGRQVDPCSLVLALAKASHKQVKEQGLTTSGTFGLPSTTSSASSALQSALASKLQANKRLSGGILFRVTWKDRATPAQRQICQLLASKRRICAADYFGWQLGEQSAAEPLTIGSLESWGTPRQADTGNPSRAADSKQRLEDQAFLASWVTPMACNDRAGNTDFSRSVVSLAAWPTVTKSDANGAGFHGDGAPDLRTTAQMAAWPTATARDWRDGRTSAETMDKNSRPLNEQAVMLTGPIRVNRFGQMLTGLPAQTETGGQLNPAQVCWLQGFPDAWLFSAPDSSRTRTARAVPLKVSVTP